MAPEFTFRQALATGAPCLGMSLRLARTTDMPAIARDARYNWLFLDLEHGTIPPRSTALFPMAPWA